MAETANGVKPDAPRFATGTELQGSPETTHKASDRVPETEEEKRARASADAGMQLSRDGLLSSHNIVEHNRDIYEATEEFEAVEGKEEEVEEAQEISLVAYEESQEQLEKAYEKYQENLAQTEVIRTERTEELQVVRDSLNQDVSVAFPNFWQRMMPEILGGWSDEKLADAEKSRKAAGYVDRPNFWQRVMPEMLGGWSDEKVQEYDSFKEQHKPSEKEEPSWWARNMPTWLGGKSDAELAVADLKKENSTEVFKGVTIGELREAGYSDEKIHQMQMMTSQKVAGQLKEEAGQNPMGLINRFHQCAEPVQLTMEDYQSIGLDRNDALQIAALAQNNQGR